MDGPVSSIMGGGASAPCPPCPECPADPVSVAARMIWGPGSLPYLIKEVASSFQILNDADNAVCAEDVLLERDGAIDAVGFEITALAGTPPAYTVGLYTVDAGGLPTSTSYGDSAPQAYTPTSTGWKWVTLATPATGNAGDIFAIVVKPSGTAPDASNNITVAYARGTTVLPITPNGQRWATAWTGTGFPALSYRFSDGQVGWPGWAGAPTSGNINTGTTPDEVGCLFALPTAMTCIGADVSLPLNPSSTSSFTVKLYDSDGTTVLRSASLTMAQVNPNGIILQMFWDPVDLLANTDYRLTILPTTTNSLVVVDITCESAASKAWFPEGIRWQKTKRTDAGAWSQDALNIIPMSLIISAITLPG